jgi:integrase
MGRPATKIPTGISIAETPQGTVYKIRIRHNGSLVRCGTYSSIAVAREILQEIRDKQALGSFTPAEFQTRGGNPQHSDGVPLFEQIVDEYLSDQRHLQPSSRDTYAMACRKIKEATKGLLWGKVERDHLRKLVLSVQSPENLKKFKLDEDGDEIENVIDEMVDKNAKRTGRLGRPKDSGGGVETLVNVLKQVFAYGIGRGLEPPKVDPLFGISKLIAPRDQFLIKPFSSEEEKQYFSELDKEPPWFKIWSHVMFRTGCRIGESLALTEANLDFESKKINIWRQFHKGVVRAPKFNSTRTLPMCSDLEGALRAHLGQLDFERKMQGREKEKERWIFPSWVNPKNLPLSPSGVAEHFHEYLNRIDLPHKRVHDIRHTVATVLIRYGVNAKAVAMILGHKDPGTTLKIYVHVFPSELHFAMESLVGREQRLCCPACKRPMGVNAFTENLRACQ